MDMRPCQSRDVTGSRNLCQNPKSARYKLKFPPSRSFVTMRTTTARSTPQKSSASPVDGWHVVVCVETSKQPRAQAFGALVVARLLPQDGQSCQCVGVSGV